MRLSCIHHVVLSIIFLLVALPWCAGLAIGSSHQKNIDMHTVQEAQPHGGTRSTTVANSNGRREAVRKVFRAPAVIASALLSFDTAAVARNMPESTGADLSRTGTIDTLVPIVKMKNTLTEAQLLLSIPGPEQSIEDRISSALLQTTTSQLFSSIPISEQDFKRIFDQYSDPVSYKQKFMDQNAFLVYYTQGFDGPNRSPLESSSDTPEKQTLQFGARNEVWVAWEELVAELQFATKNPKDASSATELRTMVQATVKAIDKYLALAPSDDLREALSRVGPHPS
jgi:hypothetical protein